MKAYLTVNSVDDIEEEAPEIIEIYEDPPEGANPEDDDDPFIGEDGTLIVETDELEIDADFPLNEFPQELSFPVNFTGWDETEERMAAVHGLGTHFPAEVTITLQKKWMDDKGRSRAFYLVNAEHKLLLKFLD